MMSGGSFGAGGSLFQPESRQPVAHELLVEAGLRAPGVVLVRGPEARRVRRQHLVDDDRLAVDDAKLELRVGDDDAALGGVLRRVLVQRQRAQPDRVRHLGADQRRPARRVLMFSSWPTSAFVVGVKSGSGNCSDSTMPGRHAHAADRARLLVLGPGGAREVAARDALDVQALRLLDDRAAAHQLARQRERQLVGVASRPRGG